MIFSGTKLQSLSFKLVALTLCLWLSGATCAVSCGAMDVRAALGASSENHHVPVEVVADNASCPMDGHGCCHGKAETAAPGNKNETLALVSTSRHAPKLDCCTFLNLIAERAEKTGQTDAQVAATITRVEFASPTFEWRIISFQPAYQTIPLNRGSTYLRNCVFLI